MLRFPGLHDTLIPAYRHYRSPGQAVVTLGGRDTYLGVYGTADGKQKYNRLIAEWIANGRQVVAPGAAPLTVAQVMIAFLRHAQQYFRRSDGSELAEPIDELHVVNQEPAEHAPVAVAVRPGVRQAPRRRRPPDAGGPVTVGGPH